MEVFQLSDWFRPILVLVCGMLLFNLPTCIYKMGLALRCLLYLLFCRDKAWKKPQDPLLVFTPFLKDQKDRIEQKTIYFVRHGESTWNDTFNKGKHRSTGQFVIGFIPGLAKALLYELYLILSGKLDSWFYDAPLSYLGLQQVKELGDFLKKPPTTNDTDGTMMAILRADPGAAPSKLLSSNLRRAISTMAASFRDRLSRRPQDKVMVIPSLQEISRNPDTLSITPAQQTVTASWIDRTARVCDFQEIFSQQVDMSLHSGNKPINTNGLTRMMDFCDFVFSTSVKEEHVVVGGHSIWFRSFFRTFLPYAVDHVAKTKKIVNGGIVAFNLMKATTTDGDKYMIDPESIRVLFGGF